MLTKSNLTQNNLNIIKEKIFTHNALLESKSTKYKVIHNNQQKMVNCYNKIPSWILL